jgi:transposase
MEELWTMSTKELDRVLVMARLVEGTLSQQGAADMLQMTVRQVRRLQRAYEARGASALASKLGVSLAIVSWHRACGSA